MDAWLEDRHQPKVPEKSLLAGWITLIPPNPQVKELVTGGARMSVKDKRRRGAASR